MMQVRLGLAKGSVPLPIPRGYRTVKTQVWSDGQVPCRQVANKGVKLVLSNTSIKMMLPVELTFPEASKWTVAMAL